VADEFGARWAAQVRAVCDPVLDAARVGFWVHITPARILQLAEPQA
jgi:hypothetical protein